MSDAGNPEVQSRALGHRHRSPVSCTGLSPGVKPRGKAGRLRRHSHETDREPGDRRQDGKEGGAGRERWLMQSTEAEARGSEGPFPSPITSKGATAKPTPPTLFRPCSFHPSAFGKAGTAAQNSSALRSNLHLVKPFQAI